MFTAKVHPAPHICQPSTPQSLLSHSLVITNTAEDQFYTQLVRQTEKSLQAINNHMQAWHGVWIRLESSEAGK